MRKVLPFLLLTAIAACALPESRWEKSGVDDTATATDLVACRHAAQQEAFNSYPFGFGGPVWGFHYWAHIDSDHFYAEDRLTDFCMRNKGYQLVTVAPPQTRPPAPPPVPPAATDK